MLKHHQSADINHILDKLFNLQRLGIKVGLDHTYKLLNRCGNPQNDLNIVHIAGTNGKGSTAAMLQSILRKAGLKVGLYTSPHLVSFNERIRVNGVPISNSFIIDFMEKFIKDIDDIKSTFFETTTALALSKFYYEKVDVAIIETGLGGRLDSTNVLEPNLTIITSIDIDHQNILGNNITDIASEKAGIIKKDVPVITLSQKKEVMEVLINKAKMVNSEIIIVDGPDEISIDYSYTKFMINKKEFRIPLMGKHQANNASLAIRAASYFKLSHNIIYDGLINTIWPGRFQPLNKKLPIFYDVAHNSAGINTIRSTLKSLNANKAIGLLILKKDKEIDHIAPVLNGLFHELIVSTLPNSQLMDKNKLFNYLINNNINSVIIDPIEKAFTYLVKEAETGTICVVFGSHYAAKAIYKYFEINFDNVSI